MPEPAPVTTAVPSLKNDIENLRCVAAFLSQKA
jgi:hypothetical protein